MTSDSPSEAPSVTLEEALARNTVEIPLRAIAPLDHYVRQLWDANTRLNLTRHLDYDTFVGRDVIDSVMLASFLEPKERVLDVGTGGGVPGLVLAILRPDLRISVCESVQKKAMCVQAFVEELRLPVEVFAERAEDIVPRQYYQTLTVRGVAKMDQLLRTFKACWPSFGRMLLVKGPRWIEERATARHLGLLRPLELRKLAAYRSGSAPSFILQVRPAARTTL